MDQDIHKLTKVNVGTVLEVMAQYRINIASS